LKSHQLPQFGTRNQRVQRLKQFYGVDDDKTEKKKKNVVEEIQKMQIRREERRAKQEIYK
jgi:hypothetical protein